MLIIDIENEYYSRDRLEYIKDLNPDIKLLAYISMVDIRSDAHSLDTGTARDYIGEQLKDHPEWVVKLKSGKNAEWWPDYSIMNITERAPKVNGDRFNVWFAKFIRDAVIEDSIWDGVFYDNVWESVAFVSSNIDLNQNGKAESKKKMNQLWRQGVRKVLKKTRKYANKKNRKNFIITGNGGTRYYKNLNGVGFEHFPSTSYGGWVDSMQEYIDILQQAKAEQYSFINTNTKNKKNSDNYQKFRYGLTSTLLDDGYYSFDKGDQTHRERWWYDEYDVSLGEATSGAYNILDSDHPTKIQAGVWRRDYESASVLVNSTSSSQKVTLETGFEKIDGTQDTSVNSGKKVGSVTIPSHDGIILLNPLTQVRDATFINGAYSKVFDANGDQVRSSFFASDGSFQGGTQIHKISKSGKTVVADSTHVRVYNSSNKEVASFAPYGTGYTGGVNIAVGTLYGGSKSYIVTGTRTQSPHVRIWDVKGNLVNTGCFPYAKSFKGGVNVAVGDLNGDSRLEIIVAAGFGGGPHIRILNNQCEVINPGFFAFDSSLRIGVNMAVGDLNGDGKSEIITASGPGGGPHIRIFNKNGKLLSSGFFAYDKSDRSGVLVSTADVDGDGTDEIVTSSFSIFNEL